MTLQRCACRTALPSCEHYCTRGSDGILNWLMTLMMNMHLSLLMLEVLGCT